MTRDSLHASERETTITMTDDDDVVRIWSAQRTVITGLRKRANATEVRSGSYGTTEWAEFVVPAERFRLASAVLSTRGPRTAAQLAAASALGRARAAQFAEQRGLLHDDQAEADPEAAA